MDRSKTSAARQSAASAPREPSRLQPACQPAPGSTPMHFTIEKSCNWAQTCNGSKHLASGCCCPHLLTASQQGVMRGYRRPECVAEQL